VEACRPATPTDKGKVERGVRTVRALGLSGPFRDLAHLQRETDARVARLMERLTCPATGKTVALSWTDERGALRPLPAALPAVFDAVAVRPVGRDCTVRFEGRCYSVPFRHLGRHVELRGGVDGTVRIYREGALIAEHPRATAALNVFDPAHWEGPGDARVARPVPLAARNAALIERARQVARRPLADYARLVEGVAP